MGRFKAGRSAIAKVCAGEGFIGAASGRMLAGASVGTWFAGLLGPPVMLAIG